MQHLIEFIVFFAKAAVIVVGLLIVISSLASLALKNKRKSGLEIENLNKKWNDYAHSLKSILLDKKKLKAESKAQKKEEKKNTKSKTKNKSRSFVLNFDGDIKASAVEQLRDEISAILSISNKEDEIVLCLESPGGVVHGYGLAAAQLDRIKKNNLKLTVCVDKIAASGGYMMACTADKILAAPFAIVGSIGVLAQVPNFNRLLKKYDVDYQEITAGEYKRTLSLLGEVTDKGKEKFKEQIEETHILFKDFVTSHRPKIDIATVATGEYWYGKKAIELKLVDELMTSDEYIIAQSQSRDVYKVNIQAKKSFSEKLSEAMSIGICRGIEKVALQSKNWFL